MIQLGNAARDSAIIEALEGVLMYVGGGCVCGVRSEDAPEWHIYYFIVPADNNGEREINTFMGCKGILWFWSF